MKLRVGDQVYWSGAWGKDPKKLAIVEAIEVTNGGKYGRDVSAVDWDLVGEGREVVITLENGHWAYGYQITPVPSYIETRLQKQ